MAGNPGLVMRNPANNGLRHLAGAARQSASAGRNPAGESAHFPEAKPWVAATMTRTCGPGFGSGNRRLWRGAHRRIRAARPSGRFHSRNSRLPCSRRWNPAQHGSRDQPENGRGQNAQCNRQARPFLPRMPDHGKTETHGKATARQGDGERREVHPRHSGEAARHLGQQRKPAGEHDQPRPVALEERLIPREFTRIRQPPGQRAAECPRETVSQHPRQIRSRGTQQTSRNRAVQKAGGGHHRRGWHRQQKVCDQQANRGHAAPCTPSTDPVHGGIPGKPPRKLIPPEKERDAEHDGEDDRNAEKTHGKAWQSRAARHTQNHCNEGKNLSAFEACPPGSAGIPSLPASLLPGTGPPPLRRAKKQLPFRHNRHPQSQQYREWRRSLRHFQAVPQFRALVPRARSHRRPDPRETHRAQTHRRQLHHPGSLIPSIHNR